MIPRQPEPESMALPDEALAYAQADFSEVNQAFVDRLVSLVGREDWLLAIDLGTGPADIPIRLLGVRPAWRVLGVDISEAMLDIAQQAVRHAGLNEAIRFLHADAKTLETYLVDEQFDVIFSNSILHHVSDPPRLWEQVRSLGRPGAWVFFRDLRRPESEDHARRIVAEHAGQESALLQEEFYRSLLASYVCEEVAEQLQAAGMTELAVEDSTDLHLDVYGRLG